MLIRKVGKYGRDFSVTWRAAPVFGLIFSYAVLLRTVLIYGELHANKIIFIFFLRLVVNVI